MNTKKESDMTQRQFVTSSIRLIGFVILLIAIGSTFHYWVRIGWGHFLRKGGPQAGIGFILVQQHALPILQAVVGVFLIRSTDSVTTLLMNESEKDDKSS